MKTNPFAYLKNAPKMPGARKLKPDEVAQVGDRFTFLASWPRHRRPAVSLNQIIELERTGYMRVGASLEISRAEWVSEHKASCKFDGILYRPLSKK